jgi:hypothetical protein
LRAFIAPNEAKISPCETKRNGKPLKSLGAKSLHFAESFVFKGLIGFSFRRFRQRPPAASVTRFSSRLPAPSIIADSSEERNDLSGQFAALRASAS